MDYEWKSIQMRWNTMAQEVGLSRIHKLSARRQRMYKAREREFGKEFFGKILIECRRLRRFAMGDNGRGWRLNLDYALSPAGCEKLLEGVWREDNGKAPAVRDQSPRRIEDIL